MKTKQTIFKGCFNYPALFFILSTAYQWLVHGDVRWLDNTMIAVMMVFAFMFMNWTDIPYDWKKRTENK